MNQRNIIKQNNTMETRIRLNGKQIAAWCKNYYTERNGCPVPTQTEYHKVKTVSPNKFRFSDIKEVLQQDIFRSCVLRASNMTSHGSPVPSVECLPDDLILIYSGWQTLDNANRALEWMNNFGINGEVVKASEFDINEAQDA